MFWIVVERVADTKISQCRLYWTIVASLWCKCTPTSNNKQTTSIHISNKNVLAKWYNQLGLIMNIVHTQAHSSSSRSKNAKFKQEVSTLWQQRNVAHQLINLWLTAICSVFDRITADRHMHDVLCQTDCCNTWLYFGCTSHVTCTYNYNDDWLWLSWNKLTSYISICT